MSGRGPVVVDTGVFGADLSPSSKRLAAAYESLLSERDVLISFVTVAELRFGSMRAGWGARRKRDLEEMLRSAKIVWPGHGLTNEYASLRIECRNAGHGLAERAHEADRWIAATARYVNVPLVSHDGIFVGAPRLDLLTAPVTSSAPKRSGRNT